LEQRFFWGGEIEYTVTSTNPPQVKVSDANTSITTAIIPETVSYDGTNYSVTAIGSRAFINCSSLTSVTCLGETALPLDYSSWQSATTWSKTNYLIQEEETKELSNDFTINSTTGLINQGVLRIKQSGQLINQTSTNVGGIVEIEATNLPWNWNYIGAPFNNYALGAIKPQTNDVSVSTFNHISGQWNTTWATYQTEIPTGEHFAAWNFGENEVELLFAQNDKANAKYDIFDANKLFSPLEITEPYFVTEGIALVKEEVNTLPYTATMNVRSKENKQITFKANNI
jgi:hypothetical protein